MSSPPVYTAQNVPDLIAMLPTRFGFVPQESLCAVSMHGPRRRLGFSIRVDLPQQHNIAAMARQVTGHLHRQRAQGAIIIAVSEDPDRAAEAVWAVEHSLTEEMAVISAWATARRYWTTFDGCPPQGYAYRPSPQHPAVVQAIASGQEILPSRAALVQRYQPEDSARSRWMNHTMAAVSADIAHRASAPGVSMLQLGRDEVIPIWQAALLGRPPAESEVLKLAVWLTYTPIRQLAWEWLNRETADDLLAMWAHVARLVPEGFAAGPLCLAALAAYIVGDGAQALVAVERAIAVAPEYPLAKDLLAALTLGLPPHLFEAAQPILPRRDRDTR